MPEALAADSQLVEKQKCPEDIGELGGGGDFSPKPNPKIVVKVWNERIHLDKKTGKDRWN